MFLRQLSVGRTLLSAAVEVDLAFAFARAHAKPDAEPANHSHSDHFTLVIPTRRGALRRNLLLASTLCHSDQRESLPAFAEVEAIVRRSSRTPKY